MKKLFYVFFIVLLAVCVNAQIRPGLVNVQESDGYPNEWVKAIKFTNGTVSVSGGEATVTISGVSPGSGSVTTVKEEDSQVGDADIVTLDFQTGFSIVESPNTETNISLDVAPNLGSATLIVEEDALQVKYDSTLTEGASGLGLTAAQPGITSLGTLTTLTVDDITINGNTISSAGASTLAITPTAGQSITFDGTVTLDAGVIAGATSITSTAFVGTLSTATQPNVTSLGTLTTLTIDDITINGNAISSGGASALTITPTAGQAITFDGTISLDAGVVTGATSITSTAFVGALTGNADTATVGTTVTITDNEATAETNAIIFTAGGDLDGGNIGLESDGDLTYTPNTGTLDATVITQGGQTMYDANDIPSGELGGTYASITIDDNVAVSSWNLTTPTITNGAVFAGEDADPNTAGELVYDNTITGIMSGGALRWYDDNSVRMIVDLETDPSDDGYLVSYNATSDGFVMVAAGAGDVTSIGPAGADDCESGACLDGTSDGGEIIALWDGDTHALTIDAADLTAAATIVLGSDTNNLTIANGTATVDLAAGVDLNLDVDFTADGTGTTITGVTQANTVTLNEGFTIGDGNTGTLTFSGVSKTLTVEDNATVNQDTTTDASPTFAGLDLTEGNITNGGSIAIDAITADATNVLFGTGAATQLQFRDTAIYISSVADGYLDLEADTGIRVNGPLVFANEGELNLPSSNATPNTTGELRHDSTVTGLATGALVWWDGDEARYLVDLDVLPADDGYVVSYNATNDNFEMVAAGSGDVSSVADCVSGNCLDGADANSGTYVALWDGNSHKLTIDAADLTADATIVLGSDTNNLTMTNGTATIDIAAAADLNLDVDLTVDGQKTTITGVTQANVLTLNEGFTIGNGNTGTLTFSAASKTLTVADNASVNQDVLTTSAVTFATIDTGLGANELYDMDQHVLTTSSPTFVTLTATTGVAVGDGDYIGVTANERFTFAIAGTIAAVGANFDIGTTSADDVQPALAIRGDADSDAAGDTDEALTIDLTPNATPTSALWEITSTQSAGYTFDKEVTFKNNAAAVTFGAVATNADVVLAFDAVTAQGSLTYMEDEDRFDFDNDVALLSDSAVMKFGADAEITVTHVADTGLNLNESFSIADDKFVTFGGSLAARDWTAGYDELTSNRLEFTHTAGADADVYWDLNDNAADSTFIIENSDVTYVTNMTIDGSITQGGNAVLDAATSWSGGDLGANGIAPTVTDLTIASESHGDILFRNATNWVRLAAGTNGYVLTTHTAGSDPTWEAVTASAGGVAGSVQYHDGAGGITGEAAFVYAAGSNELTVGSVTASGTITDGTASLTGGAWTGLSTLTALTGMTLASQTNNNISITPHGTGDIVMTVDASAGLTLDGLASQHSLLSILDEASGDEIGFKVSYSVNKAAGDDYGLVVDQATDTASGGTSYLMDLRNEGVTKFRVDEDGVLTQAAVDAPGVGFNEDTGTSWNIAVEGAGDDELYFNSGSATPAGGILRMSLTTAGVLTTTSNIELGNASDTTIARSGAGAITLEGVAVPTISSTHTLTNKTIDNDDNTLNDMPAVFCLAASDETTALSTGTAKVTFRMPYAMTLTSVRANVNTAPTGATITVDLNESGTTVLSTKLTIDATEETSETAAAEEVISDSALADDAEMTVDIDQVGSGTEGAGLKVCLIGKRNF